MIFREIAPQRLSWFALVLALVPLACGRLTKSHDDCTGSIDQANLSAVLSCYYDVGKPFDPKGKWGLMSSRTNNETNLEAWEQSLKSGSSDYDYIVTSFEVLGEEARLGTEYARVSVSYSYRTKRCKMVSTDTWMKEQSNWRRLLLPKTEELAQRKLADGDYEGAVKGARGWLALDPFSERAYEIQVFAANRGGATLSDFYQLRTDTVRALLSINPRSSRALFNAASFSFDADTAQALLDRIPADDCDRPKAVFNVRGRIANAWKRLAFLDGQHEDAAGLLLLRIKTLGELKRYSDVRPLVTDESSSKMRADLDGRDAGFAAYWSAIVGAALLRAGDRERATSWMQYGLTRDPTEPRIIALMKSIKASK